MQEKAKQLLDNKATWLGLGSLVGTLWGQEAGTAFQAFGALVMAFII
jgi:hypothetical protein